MTAPNRDGPDYQAMGTNVLSNLVLLVTFGVTFFWVLVRILRLARRRAPTVPRPDWIVVPGHALEHGAPSREFRLRLRRAMRLLRQAPGARLLLLGGQAPGQPRSEARVGLDYLRDRGVPAERVVLEERSRNTLENFQQALPWLAERGTRKVLLVTSRYHLARACAMAGNLGLRVCPYPADLRWRWRRTLGLRLLWEAYLLHWYYAGCIYARLTGNRAMLARVQRGG